MPQDFLLYTFVLRALTNRTKADKVIEAQKGKRGNKICTISCIPLQINML